MIELMIELFDEFWDVLFFFNLRMHKWREWNCGWAGRVKLKNNLARGKTGQRPGSSSSASFTEGLQRMPGPMTERPRAQRLTDIEPHHSNVRNVHDSIIYFHFLWFCQYKNNQNCKIVIEILTEWYFSYSLYCKILKWLWDWNGRYSVYKLVKCIDVDIRVSFGEFKMIEFSNCKPTFATAKTLG